MRKIEKDEAILQDIFLKHICENVACGSQRCDCSPPWVEACGRYQKFKEDIQKFLNGNYTI